MKTLYLVPWIEVEFGWGDRPEGFKVFNNKDECISQTKKDFQDGEYEGGGGYFGPVNPLCYYEIPFDKNIKKKGWIDKLPKFHSDLNYI